MNKDIKRLDLNTPDGAQLNMDALYQIAPSVFTESRDEKTGELKRVVNFDALRQLLGDNAVDENRETYEFRWVGKDAAKAEAARAIDKTLRPVVEDSVDWDTTKNLYIEGDNLEVLKLLQRSYMGKVKMIYIDPPYNTGNDFVYHDDFAMSSDEYEEASEAIDDFGNKYFKNTETSGRFHSDWCNMIYPRLMVARSLLSEDGVIFISIDDNEVENLRNICDEVFGEYNIVAQIPWQSRASIQNDTDFSVNHEYIIAYARNRRHENRRLKESNYFHWHNDKSFACKPLPLDISKFDNPDNDPRGPWKADPFDAPNIRPNLTYPILNPNTGVQHLPPRGRHWRTDSYQFSSAFNDNRILFGKDGKGRPQLKVFYEEKKEFGSIDNSWFSADRIGTTTNGTKEVMSIFDGKKYFDMPKPISLLRKLLYLANLKDDSIILDFFSGSATTAHSVMQLNSEDGGRRQFIMIQIQEETLEESEARKDGYKNICEIGKERIRRVGKKIKEEHPEVADTLDTGFRVFRLDDSNFNPGVKASPSEYNQQQLDLFANNIKSDRNDLDLLFGSILAWGLQLDLPMETEEVDGCKIYTVNDGDLVACFAEKVTDKVIEAMAEKEPLRVLFRDSCFDSDDKKINLFETFKQKLDWTDDEAFNNIRVI
ncbi:MAG: site-specific DNA-methyltransferase [Prevotella sp.]|nr:site-specific DNA-methyltransferase [Prevotella sp.]